MHGRRLLPGQYSVQFVMPSSSSISPNLTVSAAGVTTAYSNNTLLVVPASGLTSMTATCVSWASMRPAPACSPAWLWL